MEPTDLFFEIYLSEDSEAFLHESSPEEFEEDGLYELRAAGDEAFWLVVAPPSGVHAADLRPLRWDKAEATLHQDYDAFNTTMGPIFVDHDENLLIIELPSIGS